MEKTVDGLIAANPDVETLRKAFNDRFGLKLGLKRGRRSGSKPAKKTPASSRAPQPRNKPSGANILLTRARLVLRSELTDLEQFVLVQIFDQSWKDHLYAMDVLKAGIGLLSFAEQDPRVMFKKEGFNYFREMMAGVRDKVTDLIFRARVVCTQQARNAYKETAAVHEAPTGYGVAENLAASAGAEKGQPPAESPDAEAQGEGAKVKTIVREAAKVGRNDPCPCGSGKKYKKCHGAGVA